VEYSLRVECWFVAPRVLVRFQLLAISNFFLLMLYIFIEVSSNGRTSDFGPDNVGSIPATSEIIEILLKNEI
jgi:hypothetical protein